MVRGTHVIEDRSDSMVGHVSGLLCDPDRGAVVGFFVHTSAAHLFLSVHDIVSWGAYIHIRDADRLADPHDIVRVRHLLADPRVILGQRIITQRAKMKLGVCRDVQFDTRRFMLEWLFPTVFFFFSRPPVPVADIIEVKRNAIIVREPLRTVQEPVVDALLDVQPLKDVIPAASMAEHQTTR